MPALPAGHSQTIFARGYRNGLGGTSAAKALNLARLGLRVTLKTCVGSDVDADRIRAAISHPGINVIDVADRGTPTERHVNLMSDDGGRVSVYLSVSGSVSDPMPPVARTALSSARVAVMDLSDHSRASLPAVRQSGVPIWTDLHDWDGDDQYRRPFVEAAAVIFFSDALLDDPVPLIRDQVARGTRMVVCTRGAAGAIAGTRDGIVECPPVPVERVADTNGASDAFFAGVLAGHLAGEDLATCLRWGVTAGALCVASDDLAPPSLDLTALR
ncbi:MAG TPA: PfkB family carbohydrate kinase [Thermomicrobiales bacterium]|nr:PfkB family carbohydrate kinase [Thermomicrobiales bacterium]